LRFRNNEFYFIFENEGEGVVKVEKRKEKREEKREKKREEL
jgi:hypothetical protein